MQLNQSIKSWDVLVFLCLLFSSQPVTECWFLWRWGRRWGSWASLVEGRMLGADYQEGGRKWSSQWKVERRRMGRGRCEGNGIPVTESQLPVNLVPAPRQRLQSTSNTTHQVGWNDISSLCKYHFFLHKPTNWQLNYINICICILVPRRGVEGSLGGQLVVDGRVSKVGNF